MQGMLAATIALVAGCSFSSPGSGSPNPGDPDAGIDAPPGPRCAGYDLEIGGHKYRLVEAGVSWAAAKSSCEADGGYLLKIDSGDEDQEVENAFAFGPREVWTGLRDVGQDGTYLWTDGTAPTFTHWSSTPSSSSDDCVAKDTYVTDGRWYTRSCDINKAVICECDP